MSTPNPRRQPLAAILASVLLLALAAPVQATPTRQVSLGGLGAYYEDDAGVLRWYGSLPDYPDRAILDLSRYHADADAGYTSLSGHAGGLHVAFDGEGRWGAAAIYIHDRARDSSPSGIFNDYPGGSVSFLYGRRVGPVQAGLFFRGTSYHEYEALDGALTTGQGEFQHDYGLGLRLDLTPQAYLDLAGEIRNTQISYHDPDQELSEPGASLTKSHGWRSRAFIRLGERVVLVPVFDHAREIRPVYSAALADLADLDAWTWGAGCGLNYLPDPDNLVIVSVEYRESAVRQRGRGGFYAAYTDLEETRWTVNPRVAFESRPNFWLTFRASVQYLRTDLNQSLKRPATNPSEPEIVDRVTVVTPVTLGLAFHFGPFMADLAVSNRAPLALVHALTGAGEDEAATFTSITLSYDF